MALILAIILLEWINLYDIARKKMLPIKKSYTKNYGRTFEIRAIFILNKHFVENVHGKDLEMVRNIQNNFTKRNTIQ